jgi:hypothetical protein
MPGNTKKKEPYDQKTAKLTPEEQALREENLIARENFNPDGMKKLCAAICLRSVIEYRKMRKRLIAMEQARTMADRLRGAFPQAKRRGRPRQNRDEEDPIEALKRDIAECEDFFESDMFVNCTGFDNREAAIRSIMKLTPDTLGTIERRLTKV